MSHRIADGQRLSRRTSWRSYEKLGPYGLMPPVMSYELFDDLLGREPGPVLRRPFIAIGCIWLFVASAMLVVIPAARTDIGSVARTALIALVVAIWWWGWWELVLRVRVWLRGHPKLGGWRVLAFFVPVIAYPLLSLGVVFLVS